MSLLLSSFVINIKCWCWWYQYFLQLTGFHEDSNKQDNEFVFTIPNIQNYYSPHVMITTILQQPVNTSLSIPGHSITINRTISRNHGADIRLPRASNFYELLGGRNIERRAHEPLVWFRPVYRAPGGVQGKSPWQGPKAELLV